jgi:hypothetical protein
VRAIAADGCTGVRRLSPHVACLAMLVLLTLIAPSVSSAATLQATPSNLSSVFSSASAGDTIQLASGSYTFNGGSKSGMVTLTPASGASVTMSANFAPSTFITLQNMTVSNLGVSGRSHDIKILNNTFTGQANFNMAGNANANILVDGNTFDNISVCADCAEGRLEVGQYPLGSQPVGVTISHNHFGGGGQSDGIQDGAYGVIIDSNEFDGIIQANGYTRHVDSIQLYGASHTTITNNYLHNFSTAIMAPDGGDHEIINNNVFINPSSTGSAIQFGHHNGTTFIHNLVKNTDVHTWVGSGDKSPNQNIQLKDNVMINAGFVASGCVNCTNTNNLYNSSGESSGSNAVVGNPTFAGGSTPTTYAGWSLASGSVGAGKADDGKDIGIDPNGITAGGGTTTPPADTTPPDTTISSGPSGTITTNSASFAFTSSESGSTFQCQLDSGSWATCTSPKAYSSLADGSHTFSVKAIDAAGNFDASPATRTFTVNTAPPADTTPPDTTISSGPSGTITTTSASFAFTSSESGSTFQCQLDGSSWSSCTSPKAYSSLGAGSHTFGVKATDAAGNTDASPATRTFTVNIPDTTPPNTTITSGPSGTINDATPTFAFTSSESGSTFQCRVESTGTWTSCTSPYTLARLADGAHSFAVRATDAAGNTDTSAAAQTFTVDTTAPKTTITSAPTTLTIGSAATVEFKADDAAATFQCSLDGGAFADCTSPDKIDGLGLGTHKLTVRATDAAGNVESAGASASWLTVALPAPPVTEPTPPVSTDPPASTTPPVTTDPAPPVSTDPPASNAPVIALTRPTTGSTFTSSLSAAARVTDSEGVQRVEFWLDGTRMSSDKAAPYATTYSVPKSVSYGAHTLTVRAFDKKGHASSVAVAVSKVKYGARSSATNAAAFKVGSAAIGSATTALSGYTTAGRTQTITYTRCSDSRGKALGTRKVKADDDGAVLGTLPVADACVLKVS